MAVGVAPRELERVGRRVDDADVHSPGLVLQRAAVRAGDPHHVAERGEDQPRLAAEGESVVNPAHRQHADRTARAVDQLDVGREDVLEAETVDGVRMSAAHLHDPVVAARVRQPADLLAGPGDDLGVPELVHESHESLRGAEAVAPDLLHGGFVLAEHPKRLHLRFGLRPR